MKKGYELIIKQVKSFFCGKPVEIEQSICPDVDAAAVARLAVDKLYLKASDEVSYWYYFTNAVNMPVARYLLRCNGVPVQLHHTRYRSSFFSSSTPVLRVPCKELAQSTQATEFVNMVMAPSRTHVHVTGVGKRISQVRQKVR